MSVKMYCNTIDFATPEFDEAIRLRYEVLRRPLGMEYNPEDIATEYDSFHIGCYRADTSELLAVLTLKPIHQDIIKMRQVAVDPSVQSQGVGSFLVIESEKFARKEGFQRIELHARDTAIAFYQKLGYEPHGEMFKEVGIDHLFMYKNLP